MATKTKVTPDDFLRIERFLTTEVLLERELEMRQLIRGTIAGVNIHMQGEGGVAKSLALREFAKCTTGSRYFEKSLQPGTPPDAVIGPYDMKQFAETSKFERKLDGYLPKAHIGFVDELLRSSGLMRDALMPILNTEERMAEGNGGMVETDLLVMVTAANTWFEPDDPYTQAIADRITLMMNVEDIRSDENFMELLRRDHSRKTAIQDGSFEKRRETITLEQLILAQEEALKVEPTDEFLQAISELRRKVKNEGLSCSPRRWVELTRVCRANAWLAGRDHLIPEDLVAVESGLWREKSQIPVARKLMQEYRGKYERMAEERRNEAEKVFAQVEEIRPGIEDTPMDEDPEQGVLLKAIQAMRAAHVLKTKVQGNLDEAKKEKRSADDLQALMNEITALEGWAHKHGLPVQSK